MGTSLSLSLFEQKKFFLKDLKKKKNRRLLGLCLLKPAIIYLFQHLFLRKAAVVAFLPAEGFLLPCTIKRPPDLMAPLKKKERKEHLMNIRQWLTYPEAAFDPLRKLRHSKPPSRAQTEIPHEDWPLTRHEVLGLTWGILVVVQGQR